MRVLAITRVASVLFNRPTLAMLPPVLLFASSAVVIGLARQLRLAEVMAGVRLSEAEAMIQQYEETWLAAAFCSWPLWLLGSVMAAGSARRAAALPAEVQLRTTPARSLWVLAGLGILIWAPLLPASQREQAARHAVESRFARGEIDQALALLERPQSDFPPLWKPPPLGYRVFPDISLVGVISRFTATQPPQWVRQLYFEKLKRCTGRAARYMIESDEWPLLAATLARLPEGRAARRGV